jgi:hypothetical protein
VFVTLLLMVVVLAVGTQATDGVRVKQEEIILHKLPVAEAHAYYEVLRRRVRRIRLLRAVTLAGLLLSLLAARRRFLTPDAPVASAPAASAPAAPPTNTDAARARAEAELRRQAARGLVDPTGLQPGAVSGDDRHPWIFDYAPAAGAKGERIRIYVDRNGAAELHKIP